MQTIQEAVRQRITALMDEHNYSISELARRAALTQSTIKDIVKGKVKNPPMQAIFQIAKTFDLSLSEFTANEVFEQIENNQ